MRTMCWGRNTCNHRYLRYFLSLHDDSYSHTKYQGSGEDFPSLSVPRRGAVLSQSPASGRSSISALCCSEGLSLHLCPQSGSQTSVLRILASLVSCLTTHFPTHPLWRLWFPYFWIRRILLLSLFEKKRNRRGVDSVLQYLLNV